VRINLHGNHLTLTLTLRQIGNTSATLATLNPATDSAILLAHDQVSVTSVDFVPWLIKAVRDKGFRFVTVLM
jgi:hypothetical protein